MDNYSLDSLDDLYEPKNKIYILKDENNKIDKIIGSEEDAPIIRGIARVDALQNMTSKDIIDAISDFNKKE